MADVDRRDGRDGQGAAERERADMRVTVWLTPAIDAQVRARMAAEGRRSISDYLRAMIVRGLKAAVLVSLTAGLALAVTCTGCAESTSAVMSPRQLMIARNMREGWLYVGQWGRDLVFTREVPGGTVYKFIDFLYPEDPRYEFRAAAGLPW